MNLFLKKKLLAITPGGCHHQQLTPNTRKEKHKQLAESSGGVREDKISHEKKKNPPTTTTPILPNFSTDFPSGGSNFVTNGHTAKAAKTRLVVVNEQVLWWLWWRDHCN
ncbi:hypothetical protein DASC09_009660 [Saccharomycopsis crataegensis]|uniref:Uncharacterized protein n=1 Tax=Saccharomycopsis crataegensis TaxID=43959 RepID=A0AAV5QG46_9ASCO|nr:hypothetical protein DASC09_009660 [Saccharomycopsis crataegensis]